MAGDGRAAGQAAAGDRARRHRGTQHPRRRDARWRRPRARSSRGCSSAPQAAAGVAAMSAHIAAGRCADRTLRAELEASGPSSRSSGRRCGRASRRARPEPRWRWPTWSALAAMVAVVIIVTRESSSPRTEPPMVVAASIPEVPALGAGHPARGARKPAAPVSVVRRHAAPQPSGPEPVVATTPALEVITNQPELIRRAFQRLEAVVFEPRPAGEPVWPEPIQELSIAKVVIDPIVIPSGADVPPAGVVPVIRRVSAGDATRSPR